MLMNVPTSGDAIRRTALAGGAAGTTFGESTRAASDSTATGGGTMTSCDLRTGSRRDAGDTDAELGPWLDARGLGAVVGDGVESFCDGTTATNGGALAVTGTAGFPGPVGARAESRCVAYHPAAMATAATTTAPGHLVRR